MESSRTEKLKNNDYPGIIREPGFSLPARKTKCFRQQILFYFMDRFSNSRSWQTAAKLAAFSEWMEERDIVVILVGDYDHLLPATRLAFEIKLPFLLLADHDDALWKRYGKPVFGTERRQNAYVLVDGSGKVRFSLGGDSSAAVLRTKELVKAIDSPCYS